MKIAFIGGRDISSLGGIENYMFNLATRLAAQGHEPIVYCESDHYGEQMVNGFRVVYQKSLGGRFLCKILVGLTATIDALLRRRGVVLFHYNTWAPALWAWIPRMFGRTAVMQNHGLEWKRTKYSHRQQRIIKFMEGIAVRINNNITAVSDEQREYFAAEYGRSCTTVTSAVDIPDTTTAAPSDILDRLGLQNESYFLYLGRLVQDKNPDFLIRAYVRSGITSKKLVIAGDNNQLPHYVEHLRSLARGCDGVLFTGAVYGADKEALLRNCFAFCLPSTIEGLAITLLEAMSCGRRCLVSDIPANREGIGPQGGAWVRPENEDDLVRELTLMAEHPERTAPDGGIFRRRVSERFTWESVSRQYVKYIESLNIHERD